MGLRSRSSNRADRAHLPQPSGAHRRSTRIEPHRRTRSDGARQLIVLCSALAAHIARPIPQRSSQFSRPPFFCHSFSWALLRANSCARQLHGFCFPGSSLESSVPSQNAAARLGSRSPRFRVPQENGAEKGETSHVPNLVSLIGFVGADPEQRQARNNGANFTILSVATQRSWKNAQDEWSSKVEWHRVCVFRPLLAARVAATIKKGAHVFVEGSRPTREPLFRAVRICGHRAEKYP